jgi:hypothetical protein
MNSKLCIRTLVLLGVAPLAACFSDVGGPTDTVAGTETTNPTTSTSDTGETTDTSETTETGDPTTETGDPTDTTDTESMAECGNGVVEMGEACDDGINDGSYGGCNSDCQSLGPFCGDGEVNGGDETCDDGDDQNGNGCNNDCAESGLVLWTASYNSPANDIDSGNGIDVDSDGNVIAVGSTRRIDIGQGTDVWVRKYDDDGSVLWTSTYNDPDNSADLGADVAVAGIGSIYVVGDTRRDDLGEYYNILVAKYDADGNLLWDENHSSVGSAYDTSGGAALDDQGNLFVAGYLGKSGDTGDAWVGKYDSNGASQWTRTYAGDGNDDDYAWGAAHDGNGGVVVAGQEYNLVNGADIWLRRYDGQGGTMWTVTYDSNANATDEAQDVAMDGEGNFVVTGTANGAIWVAKYDAQGTHMWDTTFENPGGGPGDGFGVAADSEGNVLVAGRIDRADLGEGWNIMVLKYDPTGTLLWSRTETSGTPNGMDGAADIVADASDNVLVVGSLDRSDIGESRNIWVRKYTP